MNDSTFSPVIFSYSRAQALADGVLVDVSDVAREAGFRLPVALTANAWAYCVVWNEKEASQNAAGQDEHGRLWDVLWLARLAARAAKDQSQVDYPVQVIQPNGTPERVGLRLTIGPGDDGEPVITISLPYDD